MVRLLGWFLAVIVGVTLFWVEPLFSIAGESEDTRDSTALVFTQGIDSYRWGYLLDYRRSFSENLVISVRENFNSSLLVSREKWKNDQKLIVDVDRKLSPLLTWGSSLSGGLLRDQHSGEENNIREYTILSGLSFQRWGPFKGKSLVGYGWDERYHRKDRGVTYQSGAGLIPLSLWGYGFEGSFWTEGHRLGQRQDEDRVLTLRVGREFTPGTQIQVDLRGHRKRDDYYISDLPIIESRVENLKHLKGLVTYRIRQRGRLNVFSEVTMKDIEATTPDKARGKEDFKIHNGLVLDQAFSKGRVSWGLDYLVQNQFFEGVPENDFEAKKWVMKARAGYRISGSDSAAFQLLTSKYQYDSPDTVTENNDRDELRYFVNLTVKHRFSPYLVLIVGGGVDLFHRVYVFKEMSANNNWNRVFRFSPQVFYNPSPRFSVINRFGVLANYTTYDFELTSDVQSYLFRQFSWEDSTTFLFTKKWGLGLIYLLELEDTGKLLWEEWVQELGVKRRSQSLKLALKFQGERGLGLSSGLDFYLREEWFPATDSGRGQKFQEIRGLGPTIGLKYVYGELIRVELAGVHRKVHDQQRGEYLQTFVDFNFRWFF